MSSTWTGESSSGCVAYPLRDGHELYRTKRGNADQVGYDSRLQTVGALLQFGSLLGGEDDFVQTILDHLGVAGEGQFASGIEDQILDFAEIGGGVGLALEAH